jgi:hypothetical protein
MFGQLATDGDRTSTGGEVIGRSHYFDERGKMYARKENKATCGNCPGAWPIYGTASGWTDEGQPFVRDLDKVLCPCRKNVVFAYGGSTSFYYDNETSAMATAAPSQSTRAATYDEQFTLRDGNGSILADTYYTIKSGGVQVHGVTDTSGRTTRYPTDGAKRVSVYLGHLQET